MPFSDFFRSFVSKPQATAQSALELLRFIVFAIPSVRIKKAKTPYVCHMLIYRCVYYVRVYTRAYLKQFKGRFPFPILYHCYTTPRSLNDLKKVLEINFRRYFQDVMHQIAEEEVIYVCVFIDIVNTRSVNFINIPAYVSMRIHILHISSITVDLIRPLYTMNRRPKEAQNVVKWNNVTINRGLAVRPFKKNQERRAKNVYISQGGKMSSTANSTRIARSPHAVSLPYTRITRITRKLNPHLIGISHIYLTLTRTAHNPTGTAFYCCAALSVVHVMLYIIHHA
jgi:hypothetical protein